MSVSSNFLLLGVAAGDRERRGVAVRFPGYCHRREGEYTGSQSRQIVGIASSVHSHTYACKFTMFLTGKKHINIFIIRILNSIYRVSKKSVIFG